jgi:hypothetical protein
MLEKKTVVFACLLACLVLAAGLIGQEATRKQAAAKKPAAKTASKMLLPDWVPEKGSYEQPADKLGGSPSQPWTATTINAGVDKKPLPGKLVTLAGEIIDYSCYLQLGKHGEKHKTCGIACLKNGQPIGLLTKDGTIYLLMAEEHDPRRDGKTAFRDVAIEHFAQIVQVTGTESAVNGQRALYVQGYATP